MGDVPKNSSNVKIGLLEGKKKIPFLGHQFLGGHFFPIFTKLFWHLECLVFALYWLQLQRGVPILASQAYFYQESIPKKKIEKNSKKMKNSFFKKSQWLSYKGNTYWGIFPWWKNTCRLHFWGQRRLWSASWEKKLPAHGWARPQNHHTSAHFGPLFPKSTGPSGPANFFFVLPEYF